ncbi:MAG TPA: ribonuclease HI family protein [Caldilineae bacterium]|nr:ribonuclease HI family protein [Caldilineae bacterium]
MTKIDEILRAIASLSEEERAALWRRAHAMGLLPLVAGEVPPGSPQDQPGAIPLTLVFDGGSRGNPGPGYGSYAFLWPGKPPEIHRLRFGTLTNNEAEYDTLIAALEALLGRLAREGVDPGDVHLDIRGDSRLVINQINGVWRVREPRLQARWQKARALLEPFGRVTLRHQPRERSVNLLGH